VTEPVLPLAALLQVMARLRDPERGCPWDLAQTFATIAPYTLEEAYEVADAIESGEPGRLRDELGDLLFQVVFHARLAEERGWFDFAEVARAIGDKLVRRHPHVFSESGTPTDHAALSRQWEEHKAHEREAVASGRGEEGPSALAGVALALPALTRAVKLGKRAGRVGFDWTAAWEVREKVMEELGELDAAIRDGERGGARLVGGSAAQPLGEVPSPGSDSGVVEELGDLLFAVANWGRHLRVDPEAALRAANAKFERRFARMERKARERGLALATLSPAQWDALWRESKGAQD
jgi:nucleoside triphosphate diphosphatase